MSTATTERTAVPGEFEVASGSPESGTTGKGSPIKVIMTIEGELGGDFKVTVNQQVAGLPATTETHTADGATAVFCAIDMAREYLDGVDAALAFSLLRTLGSGPDATDADKAALAVGKKLAASIGIS
jgi:hypothetical protein